MARLLFDERFSDLWHAYEKEKKKKKSGAISEGNIFNRFSLLDKKN